MIFHDITGKLATNEREYDEKDWFLIHRAHLHSALKTLALGEEGHGTPVKLVLSCNVVDMDTTIVSIKLKTGETVEGDLVIGADGVRVSLDRMQSTIVRWLRSLVLTFSTSVLDKIVHRHRLRALLNRKMLLPVVDPVR
jgi:2-polyprenyl-6-methoxyphenol hydroxylase-like FAD-dependent oxidoreductase